MEQPVDFPAELRQLAQELPRWLDGGPYPVPAPADLAEAFRWSVSAYDLIWRGAYDLTS